MELLQVILIVLCVYVGLRLIFKYFGKSILKWLGKKAMQQIGKRMERSGQFNPFESKKESYQSTTNTESTRVKPKKKVVGEYVDFEEID